MLSQQELIVVCPECDSSTDAENIEEAEEIINQHNSTRHDGKQVAGIGRDAVPVDEFESGDYDPLKANRLVDDAGPMGNHPDGVRGGCKECGIIALFDAEFQANEAVDKHNEIVHGGEDVAGTVAWDVPDLPSLLELRENMTDEEFFTFMLNMGRSR